MKKTKLRICLFPIVLLISFTLLSNGTGKQIVFATSSSEYATQALSDEKNATQNNDFTSFDIKWAYEGTDLGFNYSTTSTTFKIWSPTATSVQLISYGTNTNPTAAQVSAKAMTRGTSATPTNHATNTIGVWTLTVPGNQNGMVYAYKLTFADGTVSDYAGSTYGTLSTSSVSFISGL